MFILWLADAFKAKLSEAQLGYLARSIVQTDDTRKQLVDAVADDERFRGVPGPIGPDGAPGDPGRDAEGVVGCVVAYLGSPDSLPDAWRICDGSKLPREEFEELAAVLHEVDEYEVTLPDLRGYFLRGLDPAGQTDPQGRSRSLGDVQQDEFKSHSHRIAHWTDGGDRDIPFANKSGRPDHRSYPEGGAETRPKNIAVHWVIRVRDE